LILGIFMPVNESVSYYVQYLPHSSAVLFANFFLLLSIGDKGKDFLLAGKKEDGWALGLIWVSFCMSIGSLILLLLETKYAAIYDTIEFDSTFVYIAFFLSYALAFVVGAYYVITSSIVTKNARHLLCSNTK